MFNPKSQAAMELVLLIAALLFIFLPIFYFLGDYSLKSGAQIVSSQVNQIGKKLVDESREMYYLGLFSKEIITVNIPDRVVGMNTIIINNSGDFEYYLMIEYYKDQSRMNATFPSEVPIVTYKPCYIEPNIAAACSGPGVDCYLCEFNTTDCTPGVKNFKLETVTWNKEFAVNITQVQLW